MDDSTKDDVPQKLVFDLASACIFSSLSLLLLYVIFSGYSDWKLSSLMRFLSVLLCFSSFFAVLIRLVNKSVGILLFVIYILLSLINLEHIIVNNANLNILFGHFTLKAAFRDSILNLNLFLHILIFTTSIMISLGVSHWIKIRSYVIFGFLAISLAIELVIPRDPLVAPWTQRNLILDNISAVFSSYSSLKVESLKSSKHVIGSSVISPLSYRPKKIIMLIIEGMSQVHVESGLMDRLRSWQKKGLSVHSFVSHQKQTNRGLFSLLCGERPNLIKNESKSDLLSANKIVQNCLPHELSKLNYTNYFLQSAPLEFMNKAQFAKKVGFDYVVGASEFEADKLISSWGVADETVLAASLDILKREESQFVTILTSNTHHPYVTTRGRGSFEGAIRHIDNVLDNYLKKVAKDFKEPPLIVITSDEAFIENKNLPPHFSNWSFLLFLHPSLKEKKIKKAFAQKDLAWSMIDMLNAGNMPFKNSRSILREYEDQNIVFSNIYTKKLFQYDGDFLLTCDFSFNCRKQKVGKDLFSFPVGGRTIEAPQRLVQTVLANDVTFNSGDVFYRKSNIKFKDKEVRVLFSEIKINPGENNKVSFWGTKGFIKRFGVYVCGRPQSKEEFLTLREVVVLPDQFKNKILCLSLALENRDNKQKVIDSMTVQYE